MVSKRGDDMMTTFEFNLIKLRTARALREMSEIEGLLVSGKKPAFGKNAGLIFILRMQA